MTLYHDETPIPEVEIRRRADRIEEQATVAWHAGNTTAASGLLRLARQLRLHAPDTSRKAAAC